jgi:hypothetical protein
MGTLLSYSVVVYKTYWRTTTKVGGFPKDENMQYFLIALYWYFSDPVSGKKIIKQTCVLIFKTK